MNLAKYRKTIVAVLGVAGVVAKAYADGHIDPAEYGEIAIAVATALGVWAVRNKPEAVSSKTI
jgi:uncharacterized membrane protein YebE (DUF533 family)